MKGLNNIMKKLKMDKWIRRMDWYIIKKFLGTYFFAIALIISIAVVFDVNEWIDNFIITKHQLRLLSLIIMPILFHIPRIFSVRCLSSFL